MLLETHDVMTWGTEVSNRFPVFREFICLTVREYDAVNVGLAKTIRHRLEG